MREIRFRAWDNISKKMLLDGTINERTDFKLAIACNGGLIGYKDDLLSESTIERIADEEYDIMQFTGLHDKNGKEIYEGDIVIIHWKHSFLKCVITWNEKDASFGTYWNGRNQSIHRRRQTPTTLEVIGNIYENPELIK